MKSFQIAVVLLVLCIGTLEALKCNRCVPARLPGGSCHTTRETCSGLGEVCASAVSSGIVPSHFRRCMKASDAAILNSSPYFTVYTCDTDLCN